MTLDIVHGVHDVLALEKKKRGMMQEVLVQKLTTPLPTDSKFAAALAVSISGRLICLPPFKRNFMIGSVATHP